MEINYLGHASFKIKGRSVIVVTDPFDPKKVGLKFPAMKADIVTVSHDHFDHNNTALVTDTKMVISEPGEYEIADVSIIGIKTYHDKVKGAERGLNTIFLIEIDGVRILHLGDLGHKLSDSQIERIGDIDVLMIPIGGEFTIGSDDAVEIVRSLEPKYIVPMHYQSSGLDEKAFAKLEKPENFFTKSNLTVEKMDKLIIKSEIIEEDQKIIFLEIKNN